MAADLAAARQAAEERPKRAARTARSLLYGIELRSSVALPGLPPSDGDHASWIDVELSARKPAERTGVLHYQLSPDLEPDALRVMLLPHGDFEFWLGDGTWARIDRDGTRIEIFTPPDSTFDDTLSYLYGVLAGFAVRLRGLLALHASAVVVENSAFAFVGQSGAGKSTVAAAFVQKGYAVLTEDVVALSATPGGVIAHRGHADVRLWPSGAALLRTQPLVRVSAAWPKLVMPTAVPHADAPLAGIYVLQDRDDPAVAQRGAPLGASEALLALLPHTYVSHLMRREDRPRELAALGALVHDVPVRALVVPSLPDGFGALRDMLLGDLPSAPLAKA